MSVKNAVPRTVVMIVWRICRAGGRSCCREFLVEEL